MSFSMDEIPEASNFSQARDDIDFFEKLKSPLTGIISYWHCLGYFNFSVLCTVCVAHQPRLNQVPWVTVTGLVNHIIKLAPNKIVEDFNFVIFVWRLIQYFKCIVNHGALVSNQFYSIPNQNQNWFMKTRANTDSWKL